jgi:hypothetical protein
MYLKIEKCRVTRQHVICMAAVISPSMISPDSRAREVYEECLHPSSWSKAHMRAVAVLALLLAAAACLPCAAAMRGGRKVTAPLVPESRVAPPAALGNATATRRQGQFD